LPLQSFLALVVPQPPLPLQEFRPLQACFSFLLLVAFLPESDLVVALSPPVFCAIAEPVVPATKPVNAAPIKRARMDFVIGNTPSSFSYGWRELLDCIFTTTKSAPGVSRPCLILFIQRGFCLWSTPAVLTSTILGMVMALLTDLNLRRRNVITNPGRNRKK